MIEIPLVAFLDDPTLQGGRQSGVKTYKARSELAQEMRQKSIQGRKRRVFFGVLVALLTKSPCNTKKGDHRSGRQLSRKR